MKKNDVFVIEQKISLFCKSKGWDINNLTTEQLLIISNNVIKK